MRFPIVILSLILVLCLSLRTWIQSSSLVVTWFGPLPPQVPGSLPCFAYWKCQVNCWPTTLMMRSFGCFASTLFNRTQA